MENLPFDLDAWLRGLSKPDVKSFAEEAAVMASRFRDLLSVHEQIVKTYETEGRSSVALDMKNLSTATANLAESLAKLSGAALVDSAKSREVVVDRLLEKLASFDERLQRLERPPEARG